MLRFFPTPSFLGQIMGKSNQKSRLGLQSPLVSASSKARLGREEDLVFNLDNGAKAIFQGRVAQTWPDKEAMEARVWN